MWPSIFSTLFWGCYIWTGISFSWVHAAPATQLPSPWYLQELQTSSIASSTTDILATTSNGTHIFVMTADDFLHLYSYSETGEPNATLGFIGSFNISRSVQDELATGLNWRTSSAFALQYNEHTKELYAIKYVVYVLRSLAIYILDPYTYSVVGSLIYGEVDTYEGYWNSNARNP
ncbi:hypothetical protein BKA69DRAFT_673853 [Paraphysoderma sedebokerense]|nr:hypothetical protein BKA69DRAFT_673853 [Paraphysoderma sedebokerense]